MIYSYPRYYIVPQWNISAFFAPHFYLLSATAIVFFWLFVLCSGESFSSSVIVFWAVKFAKPQHSE